MFLAPIATIICGFAPAPEDPGLLAALPKDCFAAVETGELARWLENGLDQAWLHRLRDLPPVKEALASAPMQPEGALALGSFFLGKPVLPALAEVCKGGVALGLGVDGGVVVPYAIMDSDDADALEGFLKLLARKVESSQGLPNGNIWNASEEFQSAKIWSVGKELAFGFEGDRLYISADKDHVKRMLSAKADERTLAHIPLWEKTKAMSESMAQARLWLDIERLENDVPKSDLAELRSLASQPEVHFLLGSQFAQIGSSKMTVTEIWGDDNRLTLSTNSLAEVHPDHAALLPSAPPVAGLPKKRSDEVLRAYLFRNLDALFEYRADLFPPNVQPSFAEFAATLSLFLGGEDAEEVLLPHLSPWFGVVARPVPLDPAPDLPLPAVCVITHMDNPGVIGPQLQAAFQTAIGLTNVDAAQKRQPSLLLKLEDFEGIALTYAEYLAPRAGAGVDARYNLVPACAVVRDQFLIGTHVELVRDVARQIQRGQVEKASETKDFIELNGASTQQALQNNQEALVLNAVLTQGLSPEKAQRQISDILNWVGQVDSLSAHLLPKADGITNLTIDLQMLPWKSK